MKKEKLFELTLVTQVDPSRPACEQTETIQAFDMAHAHRVAARMFPDVARLGSIRVKQLGGNLYLTEDSPYERKRLQERRSP